MPNYEVEVKVTLQLDADEPQTPETIRLAAKQAVSNALQFAYDNGFAHDLADDASIGVADVEVTAVDAECDRCGSNLDTAGKCTDATCAFSDHIQSCPAGWAGHPEHPSGPCMCKRNSTVEFLKTGDITWASRSGRTEERRHVTTGDRLQLRVVPTGDEYELWDGKWSVLMPADAVRVSPCIRVEYDLAFFGGDYSKVGSFAYLPVANIGRSVELAFEKQTGHKRVHIIHYSEDERYDSEGNPTRED
jgi:hypothetical protein